MTVIRFGRQYKARRGVLKGFMSINYIMQPLHWRGDEMYTCMHTHTHTHTHTYMHAHRCGIRGGYMEMTGFDNELKEQLYKLCSTKLCPNTPGQVSG